MPQKRAASHIDRKRAVLYLEDSILRVRSREKEYKHYYKHYQQRHSQAQ